MQSAFKKTVLSALVLSLLAAPAAEACSSFIIGKKLTTDGSVLYGRTEDYPSCHNRARTIKTTSLPPPKTTPQAASSKTAPQASPTRIWRTSSNTPPCPTPAATPMRACMARTGKTKYGVTMTATTSATPHDKILAIDPLVKKRLGGSRAGGFGAAAREIRPRRH